MNAHVFPLSLDFSYCSSEVFECFSWAQACVHSSPPKDCSVYFVPQLNTAQNVHVPRQIKHNMKIFHLGSTARQRDRYVFPGYPCWKNVLDLQEQVTNLRNLLWWAWTREELNSGSPNSLVAPLLHVVIHYRQNKFCHQLSFQASL